MGTPQTAAVGPGPEIAVLRGIIGHFSTMGTFWDRHGAYIMPVLTRAASSAPSRLLTFKAMGSALAIHCTRLGQAPFDVAPGVMLGLIGGNMKSMILPLRLIHALDPDAAAKLASWFTFEADDIIPSDPLHHFSQFLANYASDIKVRSLIVVRKLPIDPCLE
jgi:hypothetical protein